MESEIPKDKRIFVENALRLARVYKIRITGISTSGSEVYISYEYDDINDFNKFEAELRKLDKKFEVISIDEKKSKLYMS